MRYAFPPYGLAQLRTPFPIIPSALVAHYLAKLIAYLQSKKNCAYDPLRRSRLYKNLRQSQEDLLTEMREGVAQRGTGDLYQPFVRGVQLHDQKE